MKHAPPVHCWHCHKDVTFSEAPADNAWRCPDCGRLSATPLFKMVKKDTPPKVDRQTSGNYCY